MNNESTLMTISLSKHFLLEKCAFLPEDGIDTCVFSLYFKMCV